VIPCNKTELKYSNNIPTGKTKADREINDVRKVVSFQPQIHGYVKSYAEAIKVGNNERRDMGKNTH
jgi:hypothetical protein